MERTRFVATLASCLVLGAGPAACGGDDEGDGGGGGGGDTVNVYS